VDGRAKPGHDDKTGTTTWMAGPSPAMTKSGTGMTARGVIIR
jgi:hypothetical protein